jgi:hypothetical protein
VIGNLDRFDYILTGSIENEQIDWKVGKKFLTFEQPYRKPIHHSWLAWKHKQIIVRKLSSLLKLEESFIFDNSRKKLDIWQLNDFL